MKFVLVTGGIVSSIGKGIIASSTGVLLKECGLNVTAIKIDPYLNMDAGTMSPFEHGEVYVLDDGGETDLDLGNYERFLDINLTKDHNITTGKIYQHVINKERKGDYLGKTVQTVPHVTNAINEWIRKISHINVSANFQTIPEICIIELGGTVGDMESAVFLEALKQLKYDIGEGNFCHLHVSLVPIIGSDEPKSKPTQNSIKELRSIGLNPDIIVCRSVNLLDKKFLGKISSSCMIPLSRVISINNVSNIYKVPCLLLDQNVCQLIMDSLHINKIYPTYLKNWDIISNKINNYDKTVNIGMIGKYTGLTDSYLSVTSALYHAGFSLDTNVNIVWIDSDKLLADITELKNINGILIPGGFGDRGSEGKMLAIKYARENNIPFLGICLGLQLAVIEFARNVLSYKNATSTEFNSNTDCDLIINMPEINSEKMGGSMRLGIRRTILEKNSLANILYKESYCDERHRHRYECNPKYISELEGKGLIFSGKDETNTRMECVELKNHPFYFATQFHPEFKSRPFRPSPPFYGFIEASLDNLNTYNIGKKNENNNE